jgi:NADP-dependent 3-hydroxy acid dehydrogenase YdfG
MNVVITGASRGIGKALAEVFAADGHDLYLNSVNQDRLDKAVKELKDKFPPIKILGHAADLSSKEEAKAFGRWCLDKCEPDILINNAGSFAGSNVSDEEEGALEEMIETNLYSAYNLTRVILPSMKKRKSGHIFNMSSIAGLKAYPGGGSYSISKFALRGFSLNLRDELKTFNIKVTTIYPGAAYTDSWVGNVKEERVMEAKDIADMILAASKLSYKACVEEIILRPQLGDV